MAFTRFSRMSPLFVALALIAGSHVMEGANKRIVLIAGQAEPRPGEHEFRAGIDAAPEGAQRRQRRSPSMSHEGWPTQDRRRCRSLTTTPRSTMPTRC